MSFLRELAAYNELSGAYILQTFGYGIEPPKPGTNKKMHVGHGIHGARQSEKFDQKKRKPLDRTKNCRWLVISPVEFESYMSIT